jgi:hypothetical protein
MADEDVEDLRQFIKAGPAQPSAYPGHARVVRNFDHPVGDIEMGVFVQSLVGAMDHGPELVHRERLSMAADPLGSEQSWPRRV